MKYRSDFVTNSSSSSFVIAFKEEENEGMTKLDRLLRQRNETIKVVLDFDDHYETDKAQYFRSMAELKRYIRKHYSDTFTVDDLLGSSGYNESDVKRFFDNGYAIVIKDVSYHDSLTNSMFDLFEEDSDHFIILSKDYD